VRTLVKRSLERVLSSSGVGLISRQRVRGKRLILTYHGVTPEGAIPAGERSLFVAQRDFAAQLDMISEVAEVAPLDQLDQAGDGRPRIAITMDDAYRGAVCQGVSELAKRNLPATIFVAPGRLEGQVFWWDSLASPKGTLDLGVREYGLTALAGSTERIREWSARAALSRSDDLPVYARSATREELRSALAHPGITVGSHTWSHANIANLSADEIASEARRSREWIEREFGSKFIAWLAYPYGLSSLKAERIIASEKYRGALLCSGAWHESSRVSPFARPRLNVPAGLSLAGLKARILGVGLS
jgi:peptidoglycan/xylan/chitin deacetylase (PgdA/CDA1 family)